MDQDAKNLKILEITADSRKFEIGLFWSRSLFFWGFTAIVITAYGAAHKYASVEIQFAVACAGLVSGTVWSLVNRSSKYWQKNWEKKAAAASKEAVGCDLFESDLSPSKRFPWWDAHFSVSKLATTFSDFTTLVWVGLVIKVSPWAKYIPQNAVIPILMAFTVTCIGYVIVMCQPDPPKNSK